MSRKKKPPKFDRSQTPAQLRTRARDLRLRRRQRLNSRFELRNNLLRQARRLYEHSRIGEQPTNNWTLDRVGRYLASNAPYVNLLSRQENRLNRNLATDNFSEIFNEPLRYTEMDARRILNRVAQLRNLPRDDPNRRLLTGRIGNTIIGLSSERENMWRGILTRGFYEEVQPVYSSDGIDMLDFTDMMDIRIDEYNINAVKGAWELRQSNSGFYPFMNELKDIDLTKYGIYDNHSTHENCLIHALIQSGVSTSTINRIKLAVVGENDRNYISRKLLPNIAKLADRCFKLYTVRLDDGKARPVYYGDKSKPVIEMAMYLDHIFIYESTQFTRFSVVNYTTIHALPDFDKHKDDWFKITRLKVGKKKTTVEKEYNKQKPIDSLTLVRILTDAKLLTMKNTMDNAHGESNIHTRDNIYLDDIKKEQRPTKIPKIKKHNRGKTSIFFADTETFVYTGLHKLYLLATVGEDNDNVKRFNICDYAEQGQEHQQDRQEEKLMFDFLEHITLKGTKDAIVYFHNLKYDLFILGKLFKYMDICEKDGQYYSVKITHKKHTVELRDSYKLLNWKLADFTENLGLDKKYSKAEAVNYKFYRPEYNNKMVKCSDYRKGLSKEEETIFDNAMIDWAIKDPTTGDLLFNSTEYYLHYLDLDCLVLKHGLQKFNEIITSITGDKLCIYDCLTISSLTDKYFQLEGAYEGVFETTGNLRKFIGEAVYGGRVHCNTKFVKQVVNRKLADYDCVSQYPSAIFRLCKEKGLPIGEAVRFTQNGSNGNNCPQANSFNDSNDIKQWKEKFYSVLRVKITAVNKNQQMPMIASRTDMSIDYLNTPPTRNDGIVVIDSETLKDYIKFQDIEYELLDGVYYDNGGNKTLGTLISNLFKKRKEEKDEIKKAKELGIVRGSGLEQTIKLMLNSAYGKTIQKPSKQDKKFVERKDLNRFIFNNFNTIDRIIDLNDNQVQVIQYGIDTSYNRSQCGTMILSYSKRIMNEVFDVANDLGVNIYYTDTDSIHIDYDGVEKVEDEYRKRYNKELNGKNMEQFHIDFALGGADGEVYATTSIFLGKKSYIDVLECVNKDGKVVKGFHKRLKGITPEGLEHAAKDYPDSYLGLYIDLAKGNSKNILLNPFNTETGKEKVLFDFTRCGSTIGVSTKSEFRRVVTF